MNSSVQSSGLDAVSQLEKARMLALSDPAYYPQIVPGVLPIIGPTATLELRRWGADFLAETFACPSLPNDQKQQLSLVALQTLKDFLETPGEDVAVIESVVQAATSMYTLVFRHIIYNPNDNGSWQKMVAIKSNILRRMDSAPSGVKVCCTKFIQKVILVQTPGLIADPRRPEQNEVSLALVPRDHPLIPPSTLEAEAFGLLDRVLNVFQESPSDAIQVTCTLNCIGVLVRTRASIAHRILNAILNFNPFKVTSTPPDRRTKVLVKSMERTVRAFLINLNKRLVEESHFGVQELIIPSNPNHLLAGRVQGYLEKMQQLRAEFFDDGLRKRPAPAEPTDGLDPVKRQRLGADVPNTPPQTLTGAPLPPGPVTIAQLFTLTTDEGLRAFDVQAILPEVVIRILVPILNTIDRTQLDTAINAVRARYLSISQPQAPPISALGAAQAATGHVDLRFGSSKNSEMILNSLDNAPDKLPIVRPPEVALGPFTIPQPPPLTHDELNDYSKGTVTRVFGMVNNLGELPKGNTKAGFNRLAASNHDRDGWVTVLARLATRSLAGLEEAPSVIKQEVNSDQYSTQSSFSIGDGIRDAMHIYVLDDFRRRIDAAISWLNEEWYNDQLQLREGGNPVIRYEKLALKLVDGIFPYLDAKDSKILIRFLSEIPAINVDMLERVKRLARDPERVSLAVNSIHYLALFRLPVRTICIDALEDLWRNYDDARAASTKMLQRWRPQVLQEDAKSPQNSPVPIRPAVST